MNTTEISKAITGMNTIKQVFTYNVDEIETALKSLQKQIAAPPIQKCLTTNWFICPNCEEQIFCSTWMTAYKHCPNCGQKLEWVLRQPPATFGRLTQLDRKYLQREAIKEDTINNGVEAVDIDSTDWRARIIPITLVEPDIANARRGDLVIYRGNEIGMIKSVDTEGKVALIWYENDSHATKTNLEDLKLLRNAACITKTTLGGIETMDEEVY